MPPYETQNHSPSGLCARRGTSSGLRFAKLAKGCTHYASDPRCGGLPNFLRCHLGVIVLLDEAKRLGILGKVSDEGDFWETRSLERLIKEVGEQSAMLAGFLGALKDAMG